MSTNNYYNFGTVNNDHSRRHLTINAPGADVSALVHSFFAEDVTPGEETNNTPCINHFPYLTKKCLEQKQEDIVEAEIQAARKGTAEDMWRTLWNNENLGYFAISKNGMVN